MSRIGKLPIKIPETVTVEVQGNEVVVKGPKGALKISLHNEAKVEINGGEMKIKVDDVNFGNIHGLTRTLISNMVVGVTDGWSKVLELSGTGYRATTNGSELQLALGFSHPVVVKIPEGIILKADKNVITVEGIDKELVGNFTAAIRALKKPEPYKGKGMRYENEVIRRKQGKKTV